MPDVKDEAFPSIPQALLLVLAVFLVEHVVGLALYDIRRPLALSDDELTALVTLLGNGVVLATLLHAKDMRYRDLLHPTRSSLRATLFLLVPPVALLIPALVLLMSVVNRLLVSFVPLSAWEERAFQGMATDNIATTVAVCVLAPVLEEMLFRGIILRALLVRHSRGTAIAASALVFGVAHMNIYQFAVAFLLGLVMGWLYERSRSLVAPIALHAFYNTTVSFVGLGMRDTVTRVSATTWVLSLGAGTVGALVLARLLAGPPARAAS